MTRSTPLRRTPIRRHAVKRKPGFSDPAYLAWIRQRLCLICGRRWDYHGRGPVEAHHAGDHGMAQRAPDRTAVPLCPGHHRLDRDSAHVLGKQFWDHHGLVRDPIIRRLNAAYDAEHSTN